jgi:hypothetical protein
MYECRSEERGASPTLSSRRFSASVTKLGGLVLVEIAELLDLVSNTDAVLRAALRRSWEALNRPDSDTEAMTRTYQQVSSRARERIKRLALLFADGDIDREGYELGRAQAQSDLEAAETELATLRPTEPAEQLPGLDEVLAQVSGWREVLKDGDVIGQRDVLGVLVARVQCERIGFGRFRTTVIWSDRGERLRHVATLITSDAQVA